MAEGSRKVRVDETRLPFNPRMEGAARFAEFCRRFIRIPRGHGQGKPLILQPWQVDMAAQILDEPAVRTAGIVMPRGQAKSTFCSAYATWLLFDGPEAASVVSVATDQRQAEICLKTTARMIQTSPQLDARAIIYADRIEVPGRGSVYQSLPSVAARLEGLDYVAAIIDEFSFVENSVMDSVMLAQGKQPTSKLIAIGTPAGTPDNPMARLRAYALSPEGQADESLAWIEWSAAGFEDHPVDCEHCFLISNPAANPDLGTPFLSADVVKALLPPKTRVDAFRRARYCQLVANVPNPLTDSATWASLGTGEGIAPGTEIVVALDGSFSEDSTALIIATIGTAPHIAVGGLWEKPDNDPSWRAPILAVEDRIRELAKTHRVKAVVMDPFRWSRTGAQLSSEGLHVVEWPWSPARVTRATAALHSAITNAKLTHSGDADLQRHVLNASITEERGGIRVSKPSRKRGERRRIDLCAAMLMAHSHSTFLASRPKKRSRVIGGR